MQLYKYPVKYFCGTGIMIMPADIFNRRAAFIEKRMQMTAPITGETGIDGLLIDFNYGLRLQIPEGNWHVRIADAESKYVFFDEDISAVTLISWEKFFVEWEITLWFDGEPVFFHQFDPRGQHVCFKFLSEQLGDNIALLPYVEEFRRQFDCKASCLIADTFRDIVKNYYPNVRLTKNLPDDSYACFFMWAPYNLPQASTQDCTLIPLLKIGQAILRCVPQPPKVIYTPTKPRAISEPYVCIGVQASSTYKGWLAQNGWDEVVEYLKTLGYRVLCIDRDRVCSNYGLTIKMPRGAEDFSGKYTLQDRINQLAYADFFIGLSSGLSWLAWAVDIPVIMISGFSEPWHEFQNPYRVHNLFVCHGCVNKFIEREKLPFCPRFNGKPRAFECSKKISAEQVISMIDKLIADKQGVVS